MIRIRVTGHQGRMAPGAMATFGAAGGTIGRAPQNALVLDDPDRTVSRVHAQVNCRGGRFFLVDRGSNPLQCDGRPVGAGNEVELRGGEQLVIGTFALAVEAAEALPPGPAATAGPPAPAPQPVAAGDDPFADLLAGLGPGPAAPAAASPARRSDAAAAAPALPAAFADPLGAVPGPAATAPADDPFAGLLGPAPAAPALPDDFSDLGLPAASHPTANAQRIDDLFGMGAGLPGSDPLALSPLADPLLQPNTAGSAADPLAAFAQPAPASQAPRSDHVPIGRFGFTPPREAEGGGAGGDAAAEPIRIGRAPAPRPAAPAAAMPPSAPRAGAAPVQTPPGAGAAGAVPDPFADLLGDEPFGPAVASGGFVDLLAPASPPMPAVADASGDAGELLAAFLRGLGGMHQPPAQLTPALMERVGVMLRSATEGTLQLLLTRQELKREVRAEVTMIAAQANNPLKFSPTVEVALGHLLGPPLRGFMPAEAAMRDAYDDLRAHQFGVMVGLRAALASLIERFGPEALEKKIAARSALDSLFAANRKARLWDQFTALYGTIAAEAEDDFHSLFGQAFLAAYEAQMARLKQGAAEAPPPAA
ncbi:type VI secretion system-associated FHA domain protein TagH [Pseudacidovorax intermedius]|uniref:FHA domain-containing protein n=1 Tax=Pseudacidovorax intermedius TaxID=433924 RepID=A0A147H4V3_9BURK|nr:type VI secretion system-associated FHA domain protein TagH [Pseudacidovorax intermedius]KTT24992.1 hypothetical protein NS331_05540 [Pseudacidovorax intermedius]